MSKTETPKAADDTFASKLGIKMCTPSQYEEQILLRAGTPDVACAIGPSGIGKTAIPKQVAAGRNKGKGVPYCALFMPTATQEGFFIPTTAQDTKVFFDQRIPRTFQKLLEHGEAMDKKYGEGKVPKDLCPILAIEELNRASDKSVTRAAFVLIGDRMIGDVHLPSCVQIVATMNPSGAGFVVNEFEKDHAMRRRLCCFGVQHSYGDFMKYAQSAKFHPKVIAFLGATPSFAYDETAQLAGKAFACPATWEVASRTCYQLDAAKIPLTAPTAEIALAGSIGEAAALAFGEFAKDHTLLVTPQDVLDTYAVGSEAQRRFKAYLTEDGGRFDKISELVTGVVVRIFADTKRPAESIAKQTALFISDLPAEITMSMMSKLAEESGRVGSDAKSYLTRINQLWAADPIYTEALTRLDAARRAASKKDAG
jgi:hypothetical protein